MCAALTCVCPIDHHHLAAALLSLGISHTWCMVVEDCSATSQEHFWQHMKGEEWYLPHRIQQGMLQAGCRGVHLGL